MHRRDRFRALGVLILASSCTTAYADTWGYWRHEEGVAGQPVAQGNDTVIDSSGFGSHMRTFNTFTAASYTTNVSPLALKSNLPNTLSLDFGPGGDDPALNDDNYLDGKVISILPPSGLTVELAFNMDSVGTNQWQALFGKDGKPLGDAPGEPDMPIPPLKVLVRGDSFPGGVPQQLFVEWIDGDGAAATDVHFLNSGFSIVAGQWYHMAFTLTGTRAELWMAGTNNPYTLVSSKNEDYAGPAGQVLVDEPLSWTVGRGMFGNNVADWADAKIDEVRLNDVALSPSQFLFKTGELPGDANLNGVIDRDDFALIDRGAAMGLSGFQNGDFNLDGAINSADYSIIYNSFAAQGGAGPGLGVVPEPSLGALGLVALAALRRRNGR
jgi:hypothetical protein